MKLHRAIFYRLELVRVIYDRLELDRVIYNRLELDRVIYDRLGMDWNILELSFEQKVIQKQPRILRFKVSRLKQREFNGLLN